MEPLSCQFVFHVPGDWMAGSTHSLQQRGTGGICGGNPAYKYSVIESYNLNDNIYFFPHLMIVAMNPSLYYNITV